jgi:hypothetical protein
MSKAPDMPVKMKHSMMPQKVMTTIDHVAQCLEEWETHIPRPAHSDLKKQWTNEMKEYLESINDNEDTMVDSIIYGLIEAYNEWDGDDYSMAVEHEKTYALMQRPQTTQRTADWYLEFRRCLTASELFKVFGSVRERGVLVMQKAGLIELSSRGSSAVVLRQNMSPFDWGICFEPVVKQILEAHWEAIIHDVGRFVHLKDTRLAASPDGLIIRSLKTPEMGGHLLEIKCPKSRTIGLKIPMEYFYQMQHQLEVTGVRACEYVEAKFEFISKTEFKTTDSISGWFGNVAVVGTFNEAHSDWLPSKYAYGPIGDLDWIPDLGLNEKTLEINSWICEKIHHERVHRDEAWFASLMPKIEEFWSDIEKAKKGEFILPESSRKKKEAVCMIEDDAEAAVEEPEVSVVCQLE